MAKSNVPKQDYNIKVSLEGAFMRVCKKPLTALFGIRLWIKLGHHLPENKRAKIKTMVNPETGNGGFSGQTRKEWMYELGMKGREQRMTRLATAARKCGMVVSEERHIKRTSRTLALHKLHPDFVEKIRRITNKKPKIFHPLTESAHVQKALGYGKSHVQKALGKEVPLTESAHPKDPNTNTLKESKALKSSRGSEEKGNKMEHTEDKLPPGSDEGAIHQKKNCAKRKGAKSPMKFRASGEKSFEASSKPEHVEPVKIKGVQSFEEFCKKVHAKAYPGVMQHKWLKSEAGMAQSIMQQVADLELDLRDFSRKVIRGWGEYMQYCQDQTSKTYKRQYFDMRVLSGNIQLALEWYQNNSDTVGTKSGERELTDTEKMKASIAARKARRETN